QHVRIARRAGLTDEEIERVKQGPDAAGWSADDALLLRAADELHRDACLSDATWEALAHRYDERRMIEVPMLVGHYHMVAYPQCSLGAQGEGHCAAATGVPRCAPPPPRAGWPSAPCSSSVPSPSRARSPPRRSATAGPSPCGRPARARWWSAP